MAEQISLFSVPINMNVKIINIMAGCRATTRLSGLGIVPGTTVKILSKAPFKGPIQLEVRGTRLAIGMGLAKKVIVSNMNGSNVL